MSAGEGAAGASEPPARARFRAGLRAGIPIAIVVLVIGITFGVVARPVMGTAAPVVLSATAFAGSAQFGLVLVLAGGGGTATAVLAGVLLSARYAPMGIALAPSLRGGRLRRAATGQAIIDLSWAAASRGGGRIDPAFMVGATLPSYPTWIVGTWIGVLGSELIGDVERFGLDAIVPAIFLALLAGREQRSSRPAIGAALLGAAIALALIPLTPPGVPVIAAIAATLLGLRRGASAVEPPRPSTPSKGEDVPASHRSAGGEPESGG